MGAEVVAEGLHVPEGPAVVDGSLVLTEQVAGRLSRLETTGVVPLAVTGGAPNSCALGGDGALYVCQNGGVVGSWRSPDPRPPGLQRVLPDGTVQHLGTSFAGATCAAPNDLAFAPDGQLWFTDPAQPFDPDDPVEQGRLVGVGDAPRVLDVGGTYPNGVVVDAAGRLVWVESYTRRVWRVEPEGPLLLATLPEGHVPDGLAAAADGRLFVATCGSHGVTVVSPDGEVLGHLELDPRANATNCCFDGSALWVTDFGTDWQERRGAGRLWRVDTDAVGAVVHRGSLP